MRFLTMAVLTLAACTTPEVPEIDFRPTIVVPEQAPSVVEVTVVIPPENEEVIDTAEVFDEEPEELFNIGGGMMIPSFPNITLPSGGRMVAPGTTEVTLDGHIFSAFGGRGDMGFRSTDWLIVLRDEVNETLDFSSIFISVEIDGDVAVGPCEETLWDPSSHRGRCHPSFDPSHYVGPHEAENLSIHIEGLPADEMVPDTLFSVFICHDFIDVATGFSQTDGPNSLYYFCLETFIGVY